ncbi:hypothetical protein BLOT_008869 [Blomia tropicalis]|nr:hypothetical protein BLOT_008869 [Blomia tropicalis]
MIHFKHGGFVGCRRPTNCIVQVPTEMVANANCDCEFALIVTVKENNLLPTNANAVYRKNLKLINRGAQCWQVCVVLGIDNTTKRRATEDGTGRLRILMVMSHNGILVSNY